MSRHDFETAVEITRGDLVESAHSAAIAVADTEGRVVFALGDAERTVYLRSAAKPFQAAAVLSAGVAERYGFTAKEIALISASHAGEPVHTETATAILARAGLDPSALGCGTHAPFSRLAAETLLREGRNPTVLMNNCSGKHGGMLAAARKAGEPIETYLASAHPVQRRILRAVAAFTGREEGRIALAIDGCSAPTFAVSLRELARAFARLVAAPSLRTDPDGLDAQAAIVAAAMRAHPEMVSGGGMLDTILMRAVPGLVAKMGADGLHAVGWTGPHGPVGAAVKIMDGDSGRARMAVVVEMLRQAGAVDAHATLPQSLTDPLIVRSLRGAAVGEVRPVFRLRSRA